MNIPEFCVKRPIFISMVSCIVLILGGVALSYLPGRPDAGYHLSRRHHRDHLRGRQSRRGRRADFEEDRNRALGGLRREGDHLHLRRRIEQCDRFVQLGTNLDAAVSDVRDRLDRVEPRLPDDADKPILYKFDSASSPIMRIGVATDIDLLDARKLIEDQIQYRLERIDGVASI